MPVAGAAHRVCEIVAEQDVVGQLDIGFSHGVDAQGNSQYSHARTEDASPN
jgi:hypothetical protein